MTRRTRITLGGVAALIVLVVGVFGFSPLSVLLFDPADGDPVRGVTTVAVQDGNFRTPVIEVPVGTTITWEFRDEEDGEPVAHNVTAEDFTSPDTQRGRFRRVFDQPGSFRYRCDLHFPMRGRVDVVVRDTSSPGA